MFDYQRLFHAGLIVRDLPAAMDHYSRTLNITWAKPFTFESLALWTPETGLRHLRLEVTYSKEGPQHLEIQVGPKGSFYDPERQSGFHLGYWVDDVRTEVEAMRAQGWSVIACGATPEQGYGSFVYLEPPGGGLRIELVSTTLLPVFERWWGGAESLW